MSSEGQPQRPQNASDLLNLLRNWGKQSQEHNTLLLISLGVLATDDADETFWKDFDKTIQTFRRRHHATEYTLSQTDRACLVKITEYNQVTLFTDAKVELLRLIQQYFPDQFGLIDQSRLLRPIDLRFKLPNAIRFVERYEEVEKSEAGVECGFVENGKEVTGAFDDVQVGIDARIFQRCMQGGRAGVANGRMGFYRNKHVC